MRLYPKKNRTQITLASCSFARGLTLITPTTVSIDGLSPIKALRERLKIPVDTDVTLNGITEGSDPITVRIDIDSALSMHGSKKLNTDDDMWCETILAGAPDIGLPKQSDAPDLQYDGLTVCTAALASGIGINGGRSENLRPIGSIPTFGSHC